MNHLAALRRTAWAGAFILALGLWTGSLVALKAAVI